MDDYFDTQRLKTDLRRRSFRGAAVTLISQGANTILTLGSTVVLARLLEPRDFGLVAMVTAFTALLPLFRELGLSTATIQRAEVTQAQVSSLFWVNVIAGVILAGLLALLAGPIAWFYGTPELRKLVLVISLGVPLGGLVVQHQALLQRQMKYGTLAAIDIVAAASGIGVAVWLATLGAGYWALALMPIVNQAVTVFLTWMACGWRPGAPSRGSGVRPMLRFGGHVAAFGVTNYLARNLDNILIGKYLGAGMLGMYSRAYGLLMMPLRQVNIPLSAVAVPALARLLDSPERYRRAYCEAVEQIQMVTMPATAFLILCADWVILLALGPQWGETARIYGFLGLAGLVQPLANSTGWLFTSQGRGRELLNWGLVGGGLSIVSIVLGLPWGAIGVAAAYAVSSLLIRAPLLFWYVSRRGPVRHGDFYRASLLPAVAASSVAICLQGLRVLGPNLGPVRGLALASATALVTALFVYLVNPRGRAVLTGLARQSTRWLKGTGSEEAKV